MKIVYKIESGVVVFENMAATNHIEYSGVASYNTTHYLNESDIVCKINYKHVEQK